MDLQKGLEAGMALPMKTVLIVGGAISIGIAGVFALEATTDISGARSPGFSVEVVNALSQGHPIRFDDLATDVRRVCLVPQYTSAAPFLVDRGVGNPPDLYVGEMNTLLLLEEVNGKTEYLGLSPMQAISLGDLGAGCTSTTDTLWQPARTMQLGDRTLPIYAQTGGERLQ